MKALQFFMGEEKKVKFVWLKREMKYMVVLWISFPTKNRRILNFLIYVIGFSKAFKIKGDTIFSELKNKIISISHNSIRNYIGE